MSQKIAWTPKQHEFIAWLATPKTLRDPKTRQECADRLGVSSRTLTRWERLPGFSDAIWQRLGLDLDTRLPAILSTIADKAEAGDMEFIKLALELRGRYTPTQVVRQTAAVATFNVENAAQARQELEEWERDERFRE